MHCRSINVFGTFFPSWMLAALAGVIVAVVFHKVIAAVGLKAEVKPAPSWSTHHWGSRPPSSSGSSGTAPEMRTLQLRQKLPDTLRPTPRAMGRIVTFASVGLFLVLGGLVLRQLDALPRTDDAIVTANTIRVVPEITGRIATLNVKDDASVRKGDVLYTIESERYELNLAAARAQVQALEAEIDLADRRVTSQVTAIAVATHADAARARLKETADTLARLEPLLPDRFVRAVKDALMAAGHSAAGIRGLGTDAVCSPFAVASLRGGPFDGTGQDKPDGIWTGSSLLVRVRRDCGSGGLSVRARLVVRMEVGERVPGLVFEQRRLEPTERSLDSWQRPCVQAARFGRRTRTVVEPRDELTSARNVVCGSPKSGPPQLRKPEALPRVTRRGFGVSWGLLPLPCPKRVQDSRARAPPLASPGSR
jgi:hypothetical protein